MLLARIIPSFFFLRLCYAGIHVTMKTPQKIALQLLLAIIPYDISADIGFTQQDLDLVKSACLAGSSFEFATEADGSISVKNLEGKGSLHVTRRSVDTVDLPDTDKKQEFNEIRNCIRSYLVQTANGPGEQTNRARQIGQQNELGQSNRRSNGNEGSQSNEIYQSGSGNKASQVNQ